MLKSNQPGSEFEATQHDSSDPFTAPTAAREREYSWETDETRRNRPMRFANDTQRPTAHESSISHSFTEMEENFLYPEMSRNHPRFSPPAEFYESDAVLSSSDEEFHAFDDGNVRPDPFQKQQVHRMKTRNAKLYRVACCAEMSPTQGPNAPRRDATETEISPGYTNSLHQASCLANHANPPGFSPHYQVYLPNQVKPRGSQRYQSSYHSTNRSNCRRVLHHRANSSPITNTRDFHSLHQVQDKKGKQTSHQTIRSSVCLQKRMQREETSSPERRNVASNRAVTTLPPIQQRIRNTADRSRQSRRPAEQRNEVLLYARRCSRQEVCEVRNSESCRRRRIGVCRNRYFSRESNMCPRVGETFLTVKIAIPFVNKYQGW